MVPCFLVRSLFAGRALIALATALVLDGLRHRQRSAALVGVAGLRCVNEPGRGQSADSSRPLFFVFCAQSP